MSRNSDLLASQISPRNQEVTALGTHSGPIPIVHDADTQLKRSANLTGVAKSERITTPRPPWEVIRPRSCPAKTEERAKWPNRRSQFLAALTEDGET